jgi:hypothetical protein
VQMVCQTNSVCKKYEFSKKFKMKIQNEIEIE